MTCIDEKTGNYELCISKIMVLEFFRSWIIDLEILDEFKDWI